IPRPELKHAFVLQPLAQIAPDFVNPQTGKTLAEAWREFPAESA
ncbi:MAG: 2-amino-4-hydroxy-6-hydroxymethyldihydropteridine diphosphokinase, partial [Arenimonas sp.]